MKNGTTRRGKQNHKCRDCSCQFVENPQWHPKDKDTSILDRLLLEQIPLAGIAILRLSESWLQQYVNQTYEQVTPAGSDRSQNNRSVDGTDG